MAATGCRDKRFCNAWRNGRKGRVPFLSDVQERLILLNRSKQTDKWRRARSGCQKGGPRFKI